MAGMGGGGGGGGGGSLSDRLRRIDAQGSVLDEFRIRTTQGAALSLVTMITIGYLIYSELTYNLNPTVVDRVHVNATTPAGLEVEFDVSFPQIPCALLSVDAQDPTGQSQSLHIDRHHRVWKHRLGHDGREIGRRSRFELGSTMHEEGHLEELAGETFPDLMAKAAEAEADEEKEEVAPEDEEDCGSCYGAGEEDECCNTCDDVKRAYRRRGWQIGDLDKVAVCKRTVTSEQELEEGCNVHGIIALSTGGGNFHVAPTRSLENFGKEDRLTLNDVIKSTFEKFNVSHSVNRLHFGTDFPGNVYQLDGQERTVTDNYAMYQYYVQVVPTLYRYLNGTSVQTNQFSVTEHLRHVNPGTGRGLPGVFFFYEVAALHVEFEEYRLGWVRFFTSVCAVVGGVFTVMGMFDKVLYAKMKAMSGSRGLG